MTQIAAPIPLGRKFKDSREKRIGNLISIFSLEVDKGCNFHTFNYKSFRAYYHRFLNEYNNDYKPEGVPDMEHTFQKINKHNYNVWRTK